MFVVPLRPADAMALAALGKDLTPPPSDHTISVTAKSAHRIRRRWLVFSRG